MTRKQNAWRRLVTGVVLRSRINPWTWPLVATAAFVGLSAWMWISIGEFVGDLAAISLVAAIAWTVLVIMEFRTVIRAHPPQGEYFARRHRGWSFSASAPLAHFSGATLVPGPTRDPVMGTDVLAGPWREYSAHLALLAARDGDLTAATVALRQGQSPGVRIAIVPVALLKEFRDHGTSVGSGNTVFDATWSVIADDAAVARSTLTEALRAAIGEAASAESAVVIEAGHLTVFAPAVAYHRAPARLLDYAANVADALPAVDVE